MLKRKVNLVLILLLFSILNNGFSQNQLEQFQFSKIKEGLPKKGILSIEEDKDGFIWIATDGGGLYRYDGTNYKVFTYDRNEEASINSNLIFQTYLDSKDRLWIGTDYGLNLYHKELEKIERINLNYLKGLDSITIHRIKCIVEDNNENLLVGTISEGMLKLDLNTFEISKIKSKDPSLSKIGFRKFINFQGKIYAVSEKGLFEYDEEQNTIALSEFSTKNGTQKIQESIESIVIDAENNFWLGTSQDGLIKISFAQGSYLIERYPITEKRILAIIMMDENSLLCGTENDGLMLVDKNGELIKQYIYNKYNPSVLNSNSIWTLYKDSKNRIWVGSYDDGVCVYDELYSKFESIKSLPNKNSLNKSAVSSIFEDDQGKIWIGMDQGGLDIYDPISKEFQHVNTEDNIEYSGFMNNDGLATHLDKRGNVWVGTWSGGINFLPKGSKEFINFNTKNTNRGLTSNRITHFAEDSKGRIWIATFDKGLHYFDPIIEEFFHCNSEGFIANDLMDDQIRTVFVDDNDNVWIGSVVGLFKVSLDHNNIFSVVSFKEKMRENFYMHPSVNNILSIYQTKDNRVLVGTDGGGLFIFDNDEIEHFQNDLFLEKTISSIVQVKDGTIWISGNLGLTRLDLDSGEVTNYNENDGLLSNNFYYNSVCYTRDGTLYYGNHLGLNFFDPSKISKNLIPPVLHFTELKISNKLIEVGAKDSLLTRVISKTEQITFTPNQSVFTIGYVGINYTRPEKHQYAYQLEGFDEDWQLVGNKQSATYSNLKPGNYIFKVKAANNDGVWNEQALSIKLKILPPWWKSNLAFLIYGILLLSSLYLIYKFTRQRWNTKKAIQIEREKRLQEEALSQ